MEEKTLDIYNFLQILKSRYKIIVLCALVVFLGGVFMVSQKKPTYQAKVKIFASRNEQMKAYSVEELKESAALMSTSTQFVKTENFMTKVVKENNLDINPLALMGGLTFQVSLEAPIIEIGYSAPTEELAKRVVEVMSAQFEAGVKEIVPNVFTKVIEDVKVTEVVARKNKLILLSLVAGTILGILAALALEKMDDRVKRKEEIEKMLGVPVIGIAYTYSEVNKNSLAYKIRVIFNNIFGKITSKIKRGR